MQGVPTWAEEEEAEGGEAARGTNVPAVRSLWRWIWRRTRLAHHAEEIRTFRSTTFEVRMREREEGREGVREEQEDDEKGFERCVAPSTCV